MSQAFIELDRKREVRFNVNTIAEIEERADKPFHEWWDTAFASMANFRLLIWAMLKAGTPKDEKPLTEEEVGAMLTHRDIPRVMEAVAAVGGHSKATLNNKPDDKALAPFVPTPGNVIEMMLSFAKIKEGEHLFDLGCGDGRIVYTAARVCPGITAIGIEADLGRFDKCVAELGERIHTGFLDIPGVVAGLYKNSVVGFVNGYIQDLLTNEEFYRRADVVSVYLLNSSNARLDPFFRKLKATARVVSHDFPMAGWTGTKATIHAEGRTHTIYCYLVGDQPFAKEEAHRE